MRLTATQLSAEEMKNVARRLHVDQKKQRRSSTEVNKMHGLVRLHDMRTIAAWLGYILISFCDLVTTCTLTMLGALEVVRAAYCALYIVKLTLHYIEKLHTVYLKLYKPKL